MAQATAHETVLSRCLVCSTTYAVATTILKSEEQESTLHRLHKEANKAWKDANDIIISHLLKYDSKLATFLNSAKTLSRTSTKRSRGMSTALQKQQTVLPRLVYLWHYKL